MQGMRNSLCRQFGHVAFGMYTDIRSGLFRVGAGKLSRLWFFGGL